MKPLAVIKWMLLIALAVVIAIGAGGVWLWHNGGDLIRQKILATFDRAAPDLTLKFSGLKFLSTSAVELSGIELRQREDDQPVLRAKSIRVELDEPLLVERQQILVRSLAVSGLDVLLSCDESGRWNWQDFRFQKINDCPLIPPRVSLQSVRAQVHLEHSGGLPPATLVLTTTRFDAIPRSGEAYDFSGIIALPGAGDLVLTGSCDLVQRQWQLGGKLLGVRVDQRLLELAQSVHPRIAEHLQQADTALTQIIPPAARDSVEPELRTAMEPPGWETAGAGASGAAESATAPLVLGRSAWSPRFQGRLDLDVSLSQSAAKAEPELSVKAELHDGELRSTAVPLKLSAIRATYFQDNRNILFRLLNARDGEARITGEFTLLDGSPTPPEAVLHLHEFPVSMDLKPLLPLKLQRVFDQFQPEGTITGDITLRRFASGRWLPVNVAGTTTNGAVTFHRFQQPVTGITAQLVQRPMPDNAASLNEVVFDVEAAGRMESRPVTAVGWIRDPGPELELRFDVEVKDLAIDDRFRDALDEQGRKVVESLNISGLANGRAACYREPGLDQPTHVVLTADVRESRMRFRGFPYEIEQLSGRLQFRSQDKFWSFDDLRGRHGSAVLTGQGTFRGLPAPGVLDLTVTVQNAALDQDAYHALNPSMRSVWSLLEPEGSLSLTAHIDWTAAPGQKAVVTLPEILVANAAIHPRAFPLRMQVDSARLSFDPNDPRFAGRQHCEIHSLSARHGNSPISATGWAEVGSDGEWQVHLNQLNARQLPPGDEIRAALPASWRTTLSRVAQTGLVSIEDSEIDFRGSALATGSEVPPTAAWKMNLRLEDCEVNAGLTLSHVSGLVRAQGQWDGYELRNEGRIRLDQLEVLDMTVAGITGPYSMTGDELVLGSRDVILGTTRPADVPSDQRVLAQAYGGSLEMDGIIRLTAGTGYRFFGELRNALLEQYAAKHMPDQPNLRGVVNSWIVAFGDGDSPDALQGRGQMLISPASLFEVPLILEMMSALTQLGFAVPDRTAFDYALMSFEIRNRQFLFDKIDMAGDKLALRGRGTIGFGGDVVLDFFSRPPDLRRIRNPVQGLTMTLMTNWVTVQVRGTVDRPQTTQNTRPQLDDGLRQFLGTFTPSPDGSIPGLMLPNFLGLPVPPQAMRP